MVGPDVGRDYAGLYVQDHSVKCAEHLTDWRYWDGDRNSWIVDSTFKATCNEGKLKH